MIFWILITLMILAVLAVLVRPLLRTAPATVHDDGRLNVSVYKQQLQELEADRQRGLITDDQMEQARADIERALLSEIPEGRESRRGADRRHWLPTVLVAVLVIAVSVPLYLFIGYPQVLNGTDNSRPAAGEMPSVQEMVAKLERRLEQDPNDPEGWLMLARSYTVLGRHEEAAEVLQRLREMVGDEPGLLVRYANALAMANGGRFEGKPEALIREVLAQDPDNPSAIWFAGLAANQRGDYAEAVDYWERLVPKLQGEPEALERLQHMIHQARAALGESGAAVASAQGTEMQAGGAARVTVQVSLAPELRDRVRPGDTLFIFARSVSGPGMPLAVKRRRAGDLPVEIQLDDGDAMTPANKLSDQESVTLVARIAKSGGPQASTGDLQGMQTDIALPVSAPVELIIDTIIP